MSLTGETFVLSAVAVVVAAIVAHFVGHPGVVTAAAVAFLTGTSAGMQLVLRELRRRERGRR